MFAQSLVEYGSLSDISAALRSAAFFFQQKISDVNQTTWAGLGAIVILLIVLWGRRSPRF